MKQAIRYFSVGLFTSALLLFGYQLFFGGSLGTSDSPPLEEMIASVEEEGYHVVSGEEYISYSLHKEEEQDAAKESATDEEAVPSNANEEQPEKSAEEKDEKEAEIKKITIKTETGIYTPQIADLLLDGGIIEDRDEFISYMDENGYSEYIQLGSFKMTSDMSLKKIAETLTTYPGE